MEEIPPDQGLAVAEMNPSGQGLPVPWPSVPSPPPPGPAPLPPHVGPPFIHPHGPPTRKAVSPLWQGAQETLPDVLALSRARSLPTGAPPACA